MIFLGIDLGWYGKPSGVAALEPAEDGLRVAALDRLTGTDEILAWVDRIAGDGSAIAAVDAPLVIPNAAGARPAERLVNAAYARFHAGCHAANRGRPFAALTTGFAGALEARGFRHGAELSPRAAGRYQIEVHPHAAAVEFFRLARIVKYKKGVFAWRAAELARLRELMLEHLPQLDPPLRFDKLPPIPDRGGEALKHLEDRLDAILAAYAGAHWWHWGTARNRAFGNNREGYIVIPHLLRT